MKTNLAVSVVLAVLVAPPGRADMPQAGKQARQDTMQETLEKIGMKEIKAVPSAVTTGNPVVLHWTIAPVKRGDTITGAVEIDYLGLQSGQFTGLPKIGQRTVCPVGDTTYTLKIRAGELATLASVTVKAPCQPNSIQESALQAVANAMKSDMASFDKDIVVHSITVKITSGGIDLSLSGVKKKSNFPDIDIKVDLLAFPRAEGGRFVADIKHFGVSVGSTATRVAWDILTVGLYEGVKAGIESYYSNKYKPKAKQEIEDKINGLRPLQPNDIPFISAVPGRLDIALCKKCP